jgi:AmmeMemoRadiSam system protein B/AmmeMemoRadiSam system protein A
MSSTTLQPLPGLALSADQQERLLRHTAQAVRDAVLGHAPAPLPGELDTLLVSGTFVSLKRGKHLRSCCGGMQPQPVTLGTILGDAVYRAAFDDPRFPPVSPAELPYLEVEIWLLFNPCRVQQRGEERVSAVVTGGKHGVVIRWRDQRGLLLPGVAAEHGWDSRTFLEHVCQKAGLHPSRWKDDETHLTTFEGVHFRSPLLADEGGEAPCFLPPEQMQGYTDFCRANLAALLFGGTPRYAAPGLPDGAISGLVLTLERGNGEPAPQWSRLDVQRGLALQATLFQLTQTAAQGLSRLGVSEAELGRMQLAVLYDPAMHGSVADPDLRGIDPRRRAVLVLERGRCGLAYDAEQTCEALLSQAAAQAEMKDPAAAAVFSFAVDTVQPRLTHAIRPHAVSGQHARAPAVAGAFYPAEPKALQQLVDDLLGSERRPQRWPAAMVPHAGLRFSGSVAAAVFRRLEIPPTVIILGPKHTPYGMDWAIAPQEEWLIPGARLGSDPALAAQLVEAIPGLVFDAAAHQNEHAIEVELPFLARLAPTARVLGIALGHATLEDCRQIAEGLAAVVSRLPEPPLLLISSDMNHFASDAETRRLDEIALQCIDALDASRLYVICKERHISMCGVVPAVIVMETLRRLGRLNRAERVAYATSADVTGDPSRVVGYAGMLLG